MKMILVTLKATQAVKPPHKLKGGGMNQGKSMLAILRHNHLPRFLCHTKGLTLFEVILVVALLAGTMIYALPTLTSGNDHSATLSSIQTEVKSTFDSAVLTGLPHRLVFDLKKKRVYGERLAYSSAAMILRRDDNQEKEAERREEYEASFEEYRELARDEVSDLAQNRTLPASSPVLLAYKALLGPPWQSLQDFDHQIITLGHSLTLTRYQTERHEAEQNVLTEEEPPSISLYFFPQGYVEQAYFVFRELGDDGSLLEDLPPYILTIKSYEGVAELSARIEDAELKSTEIGS